MAINKHCRYTKLANRWRILFRPDITAWNPLRVALGKRIGYDHRHLHRLLSGHYDRKQLNRLLDAIKADRYDELVKRGEIKDTLEIEVD